MSQYYYLIASLPHLFYDGEPPFEEERFLALCGESLGKDELEVLSNARLLPRAPSSSYPDVLNAWYEWETSLRNDLVRLRTQGTAVEADAYVRAGENVPETFATARDAAGQESPLAGEEILMRARWRYLDSLEPGHYFDFEKLVIYYLKLQILLRKRSFSRERGLAAFENIYSEITTPLRTGGTDTAG